MSLTAIGAGLCIVGAVAYACSGNVTEWTIVTPTSVTRPTANVQTNTTGGVLAKSTPGFYFRYAPPSAQLACPQQPGIGQSVSTTSTGDIRDLTAPSPYYYTRQINLGSVGGTGQVCWSKAGNPPPANYVSTPVNITVN